jgi:hypothetical protein
MMHEILPSDVVFAREQLSCARPDTEILAALAARGVERVKANQLLDDLHHGRTPDAQPPVVPQPRGDDAVGSCGAAMGGAPHRRHSHGRRSRRSRHHRSGIPWWFLIVACIALLALLYLLFEVGTSASRNAIDEDKHAVPSGSGK